MSAASVRVDASASGRVVVVSLFGEHDLGNAEQLRRTLLDLSARSCLIVLDFAQTTFVDSSVLGVFVGAHKRAASYGNRVIGVHATGVVLRVLTLTGIDALLSLPVPAGELEDELSQLLQRSQP